MDKTVNLMHTALNRLVKRLEKEHLADRLTSVTLVKRWNKDSGHHVHATAAIRLIVDASASEQEVSDAIDQDSARNGYSVLTH